jgi:hypothetical protein
MRRRFPASACRRLLPALLLLAAWCSPAQNFDGETDPRWLRLSLPQVSLGVEAQGLRENVNSSGSGTSTHEQISVTPLLGLKLDGSVYHPNLLSFDLSGETGFGWDSDKVTSPGYNLTRHGNQDLERYLVQLHFLDAKPYHATFIASQDHYYRNYDFFNTATVDTMRYGGRMDWKTDGFNLSAEAGYRDEHAVGLSGTTDFSETYFNFNGLHQREQGSTTFAYNFDDFSQYSDTVGSPGTTHAISASDTETFGSRRQITASTAVGFNLYNYNGPETKTVTATENITVKHTENLDSFFNANYSATEQSPANSSAFQGAVGVRHRVYESLVSVVDAHGSYDDFSGSGGSGNNDRYGLGLREDYTKHLGSWGRLSLGGGVIGDHEDHNSSGLVQSVFREQHQIYLPTSPSVQTVYLAKPGVIAATIQVFNSASGLVPQAGNYQAIPRGELTEIQLLPVPTDPLLLASPATIFVTYESVSFATSSYEALNTSAQIRLDLYNTVGFYGRVNWLNNNAPTEVLVERLTDLVGGTELTWRRLHVGAEYEDYDSNFSKHTAWRFFQGIDFRLDSASNLGFNFNQIFYRYAQGGDESQYQFSSHFDTQLTSWLSWNVEGGYYLRDISGTHEDLTAVRTGLTAAWGKITLRASYQYNYQLIEQSVSREQRDRNFFYLCLRRVF